jgi:multicomponent Na+:H+ antiporter subunit E
MRPQKKRRKIIPFFLVFLILISCWILLSGRFDPFHLILGIVSCVLIAYVSGGLLFSTHAIGKIGIQWSRFLLYIPWLLYQIALANIHVMYLAFHPKTLEIIDPGIVKFKSRLRSDISLTTLANSITLTPGTITVYATIYGEFEVHVIDRKSAEGLPGEMETRIARIFDE